ncbi:MAG: choice-of-anchor D domain-containing protein [Alphaproteobacteria bacterium]|nr:choice-of-anchor D domain-containing protein [Alphaproteobacteria bacterium]MCB9691843.1 choice-of-anchor D domain-containing protein [Alphaproteobacteria bacterium]
MSLLVGAFLLTGCNENGLNNGVPPEQPGVPSVAVIPPALQWGQLTTDESEVKSFVVRNIGDTVVTVSDITLEGVPSYRILGDLGFQVAQGEETEVQVEFAPTAASNDAVITVWSDDRDEPTSFVQLSGIGSVPQLTITPDDHDFGAVYVPCSESVTLTLENTGQEPLEITDIEHASQGDFELLDTNVLPLVLPVGASTTVDVVFTAAAMGTREGELIVASNDPRGDQTADQSASTDYADDASEQLTVPVNPPVDILFAVDQSCSMDDNSQLLAANFSTFIGQIGAVTGDWQIGVANVDNGCFNAGILTPTTPNFAALFSAAVVEGDDPGGLATLSEKLLQLTDLALSKTGPGECNAGFVRPGAQLNVIVVSDEPNRSALTWDAYMTSYQSYLTDPDLLTVSAVIDASNCSLGGGGYPEIVNATGGVVLDLCGDWAADIDDLGATTVSSVDELQLTQPAAEGTIDVTIAGSAASGWTYDPAANAISFDPPLGEGTTVTVDYAVLSTCE